MDEKLNELRRFLDDLKKRYLSAHLENPADLDPVVWDFDVRAYCVFAHAAFEQFFEELAEHAVKEVLDQWTSGRLMSKRAVTSLIAIALHSGDKLDIVDDESLVQLPPLAQISAIMRDNAAQLTTRLSKNHGASLKYLRALFVPLGMSVDPGPSASSGLSLLARNRGAYAHKRTPDHLNFAVQKVLEPKAALNAANDCFEFCEELTSQVPTSPSADAYTAEGLLRSSRLAEIARALKKIGQDRQSKRPGGRLPG